MRLVDFPDHVPKPGWPLKDDQICRASPWLEPWGERQSICYLIDDLYNAPYARIQDQIQVEQQRGVFVQIPRGLVSQVPPRRSGRWRGHSAQRDYTGVCLGTGSDVLEMGVMPDHVHLLVEVDPQFGVHRLVKWIKGRSSRLLRQEFRWCRTRLPSLWTNSYFVSTVGGAPLEIIKQYIEQQKHV